MTKSLFILSILLFGLILVFPINASTHSFYSDVAVTAKSDVTGYGAVGLTIGKPTIFRVPSIQNYPKIVSYTYYIPKPYPITGNSGKEEPLTVTYGGNLIANGVICFLDNGASSYTIYMVFYDWDARKYNLTGDLSLTLNYANTNLALAFTSAGTINTGNALGYPYICGASGGYNYHRPYSTPAGWDQMVYFSIFDHTLTWEDLGNSITHLFMEKNSYNSRVAIIADGTTWYNTTGITDLNFTVYGCDVDAHVWSGDLKFYESVDISPDSCIDPTPTVTPTPTATPADCGLTLTFTANKTANIMPVREYILGTLTVSGGTPTEIQYFALPGPGSAAQPTMVGQYKNVTGTWKKYVYDLGNVSGWTATTYSDALTHEVRFPSAGNYDYGVVVYAGPSCTARRSIPVQVLPGSGVNIDFWAFDALHITEAIEENMVWMISDITEGTANSTYIYNPASIYSDIGHNLSVFAHATGFEDAFFYMTVPIPDSGNHISVPVFLMPTDYLPTVAGNTTLTITVKDSANGNPITNAMVIAKSAALQVSSGLTTSYGHVTLQVPFFAGNTRIDASKSGYQSAVKYIYLNNATTYSDVIYLSKALTPTPTSTAPGQTSPGATSTPIVTTDPILTVNVVESVQGYGLSGCEVTVWEASSSSSTYIGSKKYVGTTPSSGTMTFTLKKGNYYWLTVGKTGYVESKERFQIQNDQTRTVRLSAIGSGVTVITTRPTWQPGSVNHTGNIYTDSILNFLDKFGLDTSLAPWILGIGLIVLLAALLGKYGRGAGVLAGVASGMCLNAAMGWFPIWVAIVVVMVCAIAFAYLMIRQPGG